MDDESRGGNKLEGKEIGRAIGCWRVGGWRGALGFAQGGKEIRSFTKDIMIVSINHHYLQPVISSVRHMHILHHAQQLQGLIRLPLAELRLYQVNQVGQVSLPWGDPHVLSVSQCSS